MVHYKNDENVKLHLRMCTALAHLPVDDDVVKGWFYIMANIPVNDKLQNFYEYFAKEWLHNSVIGKKCMELRSTNTGKQ